MQDLRNIYIFNKEGSMLNGLAPTKYIISPNNIKTAIMFGTHATPLFYVNKTLNPPECLVRRLNKT